MPSNALQSRIAAFESIAAQPALPPLSKRPQTALLTHRQPSTISPSPSPPNLGRKTSLIDLKDWIIDDGPPSPTYSYSFKHYGGYDNGRTPLIKLESPPRPNSSVTPTSTKKPPPLPPRKPSLNSLSSTTSSASLVSLVSNNGATSLHPSRFSDTLTVDRVHTYPPLIINNQSSPRNIPRHAPASSISSFHSVSLSSDTDVSTPGSVSNIVTTFPRDRNSDRKFSGTSDFSEVDSISLGESYEEVSTSSLASPATPEGMISHDWEKIAAKQKAVLPKLPQRPPSASTSSCSLSTEPGLKSPPPRPSSSKSSSPSLRASVSSTLPLSPAHKKTPGHAGPPSNRSSVQSLASNFSHSSHNHNGNNGGLVYHPNSNIRRRTPVPAAARLRYLAVFNANIIRRRKTEKEKPGMLSPNEAKKMRQSSGWRGLSVDLITGEDLSPSPSSEKERELSLVVATERLEGHLVKAIWRRSRLDRRKLRDIWSECDPNGTGSLDQDGFVKGMWRIDEELRRNNRQTLELVSSTNTGSLRGRGMSKPPVQPPEPIFS